MSGRTDDVVASFSPKDAEDAWTFEEFKAVMRLWLEDDAAPDFFSANYLADHGLARMKHLGRWLAELARIGWIGRPTSWLPGLGEVLCAAKTNSRRTEAS